MTAFEWLNTIAQAIIKLFPSWQIIDTTQAGIKFVRGGRVVPFGPGLVFYWPAVTEIKIYPTNRQPINLPSQTIQTKDGAVLAVGGAFEYEVIDVEKVLTSLYNPDDSLRLLCAAVVHKVCADRTLAELKDQPALRRALRREMRARVARFGVRVLSASLTDFAPARVFKLLQSQSQD